MAVSPEELMRLTVAGIAPCGRSARPERWTSSEPDHECGDRAPHEGPHQALFAEVDGDHQGRDLPPLEHGAGAGREGSERAHGAVLRLPRLQGRRAELRPAPEPRLRVAPGRLRGTTERVELGAGPSLTRTRPLVCLFYPA